MPNPIGSRIKQWLGSDFGQYAAVYITVVAFSFVTLLSVGSLWQTGRWLPYVIGVVIFTIIADRCARKQHLAKHFIVFYILAETIIVIALLVLSGYFFLTAMLSFLIVATARSEFTRQQSYGLALLVLSAISVTYAVGVDLNTAVQIFFGLGAGFVFIVTFTEVAESERQARRDLQSANQQLAEYAAQVEQLATMRERNRLAREVHDTLGHYLTVINVQLEVVTKLIESNPTRAKEAAVKAKTLASEGLNEVRRSVSALRPTPLEDKPLPDAIRGLIETSRDAGLMVTFEQGGTTRALSSEMETVLYRAAQESLTNIRKHAHASAANVRLTYTTEAVSLRVRDNGVGRKGDEDNVGLSALRERVAALNGTVLAENHLEGGFVLDVTLPITLDTVSDKR
jgi:signal transduction histidine kinase